MNRSELIDAVAERAGSDQATARRHVDAVFEAIMESVTAGERVQVTGFGAFDRLNRQARTARNPRTGRPVEIPATDVPRFRTGRTFKDQVAGTAAAAQQADRITTEPAAAPKKQKKSKNVRAVEEKPKKETSKKKGKSGKVKSGKSR